MLYPYEIACGLISRYCPLYPRYLSNYGKNQMEIWITDEIKTWINQQQLFDELLPTDYFAEQSSFKKLVLKIQKILSGISENSYAYFDTKEINEMLQYELSGRIVDYINFTYKCY